MWRWDDTLDNKWARVAMCSQMLNIPIDMPEDIKEEQQNELGEGNTRAEAIAMMMMLFIGT